MHPRPTVGGAECLDCEVDRQRRVGADPARGGELLRQPDRERPHDGGELAAARRDAARPGDLVVNQRSRPIEHGLDRRRRRCADGRDVNLEAAQLNLVRVDGAVRGGLGKVVFDQREDEIGALEVATHDAEVQRSRALVNGRVDGDGAAGGRNLRNLIIEDLELPRDAPASGQSERNCHCGERERPAKGRTTVHFVAPKARARREPMRGGRHLTCE